MDKKKNIYCNTVKNPIIKVIRKELSLKIMRITKNKNTQSTTSDLNALR